MHRLSQIVMIFLGFLPVLAQSPHGDQLKIDCAQCHNPEGWKINYKTIKFEHNSTNFELEGSHIQTDCINCHQNLTFNETTTQCASCHTDMHSASVGNDCARCHTQKNWLVDDIPELHEENGFPLIGVHNALNCIDCHKSETNLRFDRIGNECINCHQNDYDLTQSPDHAESGYSINCLECHSTLGSGWETELTDHNFFPLTQGHDIQDCKQCHTSGSFSGLTTDCVSCHQSNFNNTTNPNHSDAGFSTDCASCHTTNPGWTPAVIEHDFFPLTQGHDIQDCKQCHSSGSYTGLSNECISCHKNNYDNTSNPNHNNAGYSTNCASCHTTSPGWTPAVIEHDFFPLTQGHDIQDCKQCHTSGSYSGLSSECVSCHKNNYDNTSNPNHNNVGYSTDCASCHTTSPGWTPAVVDHDFFPLTLGHDVQDCKQCHTSGTYTGLSGECVSCHQNNFNNTTDPNHTDAGFSTDCVTCHTTNPNWTPTSWDHNTVYPLNGAHAAIADNCTACHKGNYSNTPDTCIGCHQNAYDSTTDPNHKATQFPTDCIECHNETAWVPSTFDHDGQYFPIYSGKHKDEWSSCTDCHTNTSSYSVFSCFKCHTSSETNNDHKDVSGYIYDSNACLQCHPDGKD